MIKRALALAATSTTVLGLAAAGAMGTTAAFAGGGGNAVCVATGVNVLTCAALDGRIGGGVLPWLLILQAVEPPRNPGRFT